MCYNVLKSKRREGFSMKTNYIITIARQFASGGHDIGQMLAEQLEIPFYDKELISLAAKESGMDPDVFSKVDERAANSLLYSLSMGLYSFGNGFSAMGDLPVNDKLYLLQHKIIKQKADQGPFVVVGRCGDYILRDRKNVLNVYIHGSMDFRKERAIRIHKLDPDRAVQIINRTDKVRANYYSFYSGNKWGVASNYDLCIDASKITQQQAVDLIKQMLSYRENP